MTAISGGKFGNGAATAAFMHVVNAEVTVNMKSVTSSERGKAVLEKYFSPGGTSSIAELNQMISDYVNVSDGALGLFVNADNQHAALILYHLDASGTPIGRLYDPAGNYVPSSGSIPSLQLYTNELVPGGATEWSLAKYINFHGDNTTFTPIYLTGSTARSLSFQSNVMVGSCDRACLHAISGIPGYSLKSGFATPSKISSGLLTRSRKWWGGLRHTSSGVYPVVRVKF